MVVKILHGLAELSRRPTGCVVTIGNFDGVHLGHQRILSVARGLADTSDSPVVAVTFEPPPVRVLAPEAAPEPLMQLTQRTAALAEAGADVVLMLQTSRELLAMSPEAFVREYLIGRLGPRHVVEGRNFFFGHGRSGNVDTLTELGKRHGFEVHVADRVTVDLPGSPGVIVSSSFIRALVLAGRVDDAAVCLGRPYTMQGTVVAGAGRGRTLDYPTANLDCGEQLLPADGVYSGWALLPDAGDRAIPAALSVGDRPTFQSGVRALEAHLLDAVGELYGRSLAVRFVRRLRDQRAYESAEALRDQMAADVRRIREELGER